MELPVTRVVVYGKPGNRTPWGHHGTPGWYIGPYLDYCICIKFYIPETVIVTITDTLQYTQKQITFNTTTNEDYLQKSIGDILAITQDPKRHFLAYPMDMKLRT